MKKDSKTILVKYVESKMNVIFEYTIIFIILLKLVFWERGSKDYIII